MLGIGDQHTRIGVTDIGSHLSPGQTEIQRHKDCTQVRGRKQREQEHRLIDSEECHPIAPSYTEPIQPTGELPNALLHLAIVTSPPFECECGALRRAQCAPEEPIGQADVGVLIRMSFFGRAVSEGSLTSIAAGELLVLVGTCAIGVTRSIVRESRGVGIWL